MTWLYVILKKKKFYYNFMIDCHWLDTMQSHRRPSCPCFCALIWTLFPAGSGKGGKSIWGKKFADELSPSLRVRIKFKFEKCKTVVPVLWLLYFPTNTVLKYFSGSQVRTVLSSGQWWSWWTVKIKDKVS